MALTSGFYDSQNSDRLYTAEQFGSMFDGIIADGVYQNIGNKFFVAAIDGFIISVGTGRAWLSSTWLLNSSLYQLTLSAPHALLDRIDSVIIEVNKSASVRKSTLKVLTGTAATNPVAPTLTNTSSVKQYLLASVSRPKASTAILQSHITQKVGTSALPYVAGIIETVDITNMVAQWQSQWSQWLASRNTENTDLINQVTTEWEQLISATELALDIQTDDFIGQKNALFTNWFNSLQTAFLDANIATSLAGRIATLEGRFDYLASTRQVHSYVTDQTFNNITDDNGEVLFGDLKLDIPNLSPHDTFYL